MSPTRTLPLPVNRAQTMQQAPKVPLQLRNASANLAFTMTTLPVIAAHNVSHVLSAPSAPSLAYPFAQCRCNVAIIGPPWFLETFAAVQMPTLVQRSPQAAVVVLHQRTKCLYNGTRSTSTANLICEEHSASSVRMRASTMLPLQTAQLLIASLAPRS